MDSSELVTCISNVDSCMNYLREASLYKMMNDSNHRAMLFLLEVLMNSDTTVALEELGKKIFSDKVSQDMQDVCGNNLEGLKLFMEKYPSLFQIDGNQISPIDVSDCASSTEVDNGRNSIHDSEPYRLRHPVDLTQETEAVKYFQSQLARREDHWVSIKSIAGHLSQASESIRRVVGPQINFRKFLQRHPCVFEIQGDLVSLRDNFSSICLSRGSRNRPRSAIINSKKIMKKGRPVSMIVNKTEIEKESKAYLPPSKNPVAIDSRDFQAAMFLRTVIRKKSNRKISVNHLFLYLSQAPSSVRESIGWTKIELEEFIRKQSTLFEIDKKGQVTCLDTEEISIIVNDDLTSGKDGVRTIINQSGKVYHITKLWGIVDLGQHEHVFFDKSIFKHLDDLQRHFQVGECIYFNAILAPKQSRAKWRATQVWKESDKDMIQKFCGDLIYGTKKSSTNTLNIDSDSLSCCRSILSEQRHIIDSYHDIDEELAEILQLSKMDSDDDFNNGDNESNRFDLEDYSLTTVPSPSQSSTECLSSSSGVPGEINSTSRRSSSNDTSHKFHRLVETATVATQTISTGDIMAVQVYLENPKLPT